jgi:hypothetical protein
MLISTFRGTNIVVPGGTGYRFSGGSCRVGRGEFCSEIARIQSRQIERFDDKILESQFVCRVNLF